jgi:hypothetical protein
MFGYRGAARAGQLALEANQRGYDSISPEKERISLKTVTTSNHVNFNSYMFAEIVRGHSSLSLARSQFLSFGHSHNEAIEVVGYLDLAGEARLLRVRIVGEIDHVLLHSVNGGVKVVRHAVSSTRPTIRPFEELLLVCWARHRDLLNPEFAAMTSVS